MDPVYKGENILPYLKKKESKDFLMSEFDRVKSEFHRAYDHLKKG